MHLQVLGIVPMSLDSSIEESSVKLQALKLYHQRLIQLLLCLLPDLHSLPAFQRLLESMRGCMQACTGQNALHPLTVLVHGPTTALCWTRSALYLLLPDALRTRLGFDVQHPCSMDELLAGEPFWLSLWSAISLALPKDSSDAKTGEKLDSR